MPALRLAASARLALLLALLFQCLCALRPLDYLLGRVLVMDDAFYFFQVARNLAGSGRATFDGLHDTSGVQLLWCFLLSGVARVVADREAFLRAILFLCIVLNGAAGLLLRAVGRRLLGARAADFALLLWSGFLTALAPTMIGMEYSLHVCVLLLLGWLLLPRMDGAALSAPRTAALGVVLAANFWTRLDAAALSLVVSLLILWWARKGPNLVRTGLLLAVPQLLGAALYAWASWRMAGTLTPVSGLVKQHYAAIHFAQHGWLTSLMGHLLWWARVATRPMLDLCGSAMTERLALPDPLALGLVALVGAASGWGAWLVRSAVDPALRRAGRVLLAAWLLGLAHAALVVATIGHFAHVTQHYYGFQMLVWVLWGGLLLELLAQAAARSPRARGALRVVACVLVSVHGLGIALVARDPAGDTPLPLHLRRLPVLEWVRRNVPADARIGAWNAGQLGYFLEQPVVNLDGLINSRDYLERLRAGSPVMDYLQRQGIRWLIDINERDLTFPYRQEWDRARWFRNAIGYDAVRVRYAEALARGRIEVLELR